MPITDEFKQQNFNQLTPERRAEIASMGGRAAHIAGTAHKWTPEKAREAGRKGAAVRAAKRAEQKATQAPKQGVQS